MRIPSGVTDQYVYFVAVDSTDFTTRETGLTTFTVYRSRNGAAAAAMTTPTVNETDTTNMPGVYELLLDEDMTIDSGDDEQEMVFHVTQASMAPVTRAITLFRPKITAGNTLGVASDGDVSGNLDGTVATVTTLTGHTAQTGDSYARLGAPAGASVSADVAAIEVQTDDIGAAGAGLTAIPWNAAWDAEVQSEAADALTAYDPPTRAELSSDIAGLNDPTSAAIADAVLDEALAGHVVAGSLGKAVADVEGDATAILADSNELQGDWADGGRLDLILDGRAAEATVGALNDLSAADVNTQVDAAFTTQMADSVAADGSIPTREQALLMVSRFLFERSVASTTVTVTKEDGSTSSMTFTLDDGDNPTSITRAS